MVILLHRRWILIVAASLLAAGIPRALPGQVTPLRPQDAAGDAWIPLFNGKDLDGWTPKIRGHELGDNFGQTFRVEDGLLKVRYDAYDEFHDRFGHLFYQTPYSDYDLRVEYRFVGEQVAGGPGWAVRNSGVMIHGQDPKTLSQDQEFPCSIEVQLLGGDGSQPRPNANLCTPGTHVVMGGKLITQHCTDSTSKTYDGEQWVTIEIEVRGSQVIRHRLEDRVVLEYEQPQLDPGDEFAQKLLADGRDRLLASGSISLQSESHPIDFRRVEIRLRSEK